MLLRYVLDVAPIWESDAEFNQALSLLPPSTHTAIKKFYFLQDRKLALGSQLLQRLVVCNIYGTPGLSTSSPDNPENAIRCLRDVEIVKDPESGRPSYTHIEVTSHSSRKWDLEDYNVSHHNPRSPTSPCLVILAARISPRRSLKRRIGVDVVPTTHRSSDASEFLAGFKDSGVFTNYEVETIFGVPSGENWEKVRMLYMHWALKEAYCKAVGTGLVTDLLRIEFRNVKLFDLDARIDGVDENGMKKYTGVRLYVDGRLQDDWYLEVTAFQGTKESGFYFAVATESEGLDDGMEDGNGKGFQEGGEGWKVLGFAKDIAPWSGTDA